MISSLPSPWCGHAGRGAAPGRCGDSERFLASVQGQLLAAEEERGLVERSALKDHVRRSLERVAVRRALEHCHILMIEGPPYRQWLPRREAS